MQKMKDPAFRYYEWQFLMSIKRILVWEWLAMQCGYDHKALQKWIFTFRILELDRKAQRDLMLLAHSGKVGRTKANRILHETLYDKALSEKYWDLSHCVTSSVLWARKCMDRPPRMHKHLWEPGWEWIHYLHCFPSDLPFAPDSVPDDAHLPIHQDPATRVPLAPPNCWWRPARELPAARPRNWM